MSAFQRLDFRVSRQADFVKNPSVATTFSIQLVEENGNLSNKVSLCKYHAELRGPVGGYHPWGEENYHTILETVRIPLSDFTGIDLGKVRGVRLVFDGTPTGSIYFANIRFTN